MCIWFYLKHTRLHWSHLSRRIIVFTHSSEKKWPPCRRHASKKYPSLLRSPTLWVGSAPRQGCRLSSRGPQNAEVSCGIGVLAEDTQAFLSRTHRLPRQTVYQSDWCGDQTKGYPWTGSVRPHIEENAGPLVAAIFYEVVVPLVQRT